MLRKTCEVKVEKIRRARIKHIYQGVFFYVLAGIRRAFYLYCPIFSTSYNISNLSYTNGLGIANPSSSSLSFTHQSQQGQNLTTQSIAGNRPKSDHLGIFMLFGINLAGAGGAFFYQRGGGK